MSVKQPFYSTISIDTFFFFFEGGGDKESSQDKIQTVESRG